MMMTPSAAHTHPGARAGGAARPSLVSPSLLAIGSFGARTLSAVEASSKRIGISLHVESSPVAIDRWADERHPAAIFVDACERPDYSCTHIRYCPSLATVPLIMVGGAIDDLGFEEGLGWGADDLCPARVEAIVTRVRRLLMAGEPAPSRRHGTALVAGRDRRGRVLSARALRNAGWGVTFAENVPAAIREGLLGGVSLVVWKLQPDEEESARESLAMARATGCGAPWVVGVAHKSLNKVRARFQGATLVSVFDAFGPPDNVLFVANEILRAGSIEVRQSARLLFGTTVRFRPAGTAEDEIGFSYNISAGGLYIRTLAPASQNEEVWLELEPPRTARRVRLEAKVVWSRGFGPNDTATVPAGFGAQITGGAVLDVERFVRGYRCFAADMA